MAGRGSTLAQLRYMLRGEIGQTLVTASATQADTLLNLALYNKQNWLASEYAWPFLEHRWDVPLAQGTRYYVLPTTTSAVGDQASSFAINFDWPVTVEVFFNGGWQPVEYGIGADQYNYMNSDGKLLNGVNPDVLDPCQRWRMATNVDEPSNANVFEVWPMTATSNTSTNPYIVRFTGQRALQLLYSPTGNGATIWDGTNKWDDTLKADLDDEVLVYFTAAELLEKAEQSRLAQSKFQLAQRRLLLLRSHFPAIDEKLVLGKNPAPFRNRRHVVPIVVHA